MPDRIKILCSKCGKTFGERATRLRDGYQMQCPQHRARMISSDLMAAIVARNHHAREVSFRPTESL
jgi:hypothetical protein